MQSDAVVDNIQVPTGFRAGVLLGENLKATLGLDHCPTIQSEAQVFNAFQAMADLNQEVIISGALNCKCKLLHWGILAVGSSDCAAMRVGDAFIGAVQCQGSAIFLVHNHPSGSLAPSKADFELTRQVAEAGLLMGFPLVDHVIVSKKGHKSLMTLLTLRNSHDRARLTTAYLQEASEQAFKSVRWRCSRCRFQNSIKTLNGVSFAMPSLCVPAKCLHCNAFTWLYASEE